MKTIVVRITKDGGISAETHGLTGDACLPYIAILGEVLDAEVVDSHATADYYADAVEDVVDLPTVEQRHGPP
jgi:hypothetical protein